VQVRVQGLELALVWAQVPVQVQVLEQARASARVPEQELGRESPGYRLLRSRPWPGWRRGP